MDAIDEDVPTVTSRAAKNLAAANTSNANKRQRLGEAVYLQEKRDAGVEYRRRLKEKAAAAANVEASATVGDIGGTGIESNGFAFPAAFAVPLPAAPPIVDVAGQLERVAELKRKGDLDDDEFKAAKQRILGAAQPPPPPAARPAPPPQPSDQPPPSSDQSPPSDPPPSSEPQPAAQRQQPSSERPRHESAPRTPPGWRNVRRETREAAEQLVVAWRDDTTEPDLDLPEWLPLEIHAHLREFCEAQGLAHEMVNVDGTAVLRVVRRSSPPPATSTSNAAAAAPAATASNTSNAVQPTTSDAPLNDAQRARAAANKAVAIERRATVVAAAAAAPAAVASNAAAAAPAAMAAMAPATMQATAASAPVAAAAGAPAGVVPNVAASAAESAPAGGQVTVDDLSGVADAAEQRELSDGLGVSSALYLGAHDMLHLRAMLEQPNDAEHTQRVLRRLSMAPMTAQLDTTTGFVAFMIELSNDETVQAAVQAGAEEAVQAASLITRIVNTWKAQLREEQKQRDAHLRQQPAVTAPKEKRPKDPNCLACQGRHRPHTCN